MKLYLLLLFLWAPALLWAQTEPEAGATPTKEVFIRLKDGSTVRGKLLSSQNKQVRLLTENLGELVLDMDRIAEINEARGFTRNGQYWFNNPFYTNYFISPSAMTLRKGEGSFQNSYIFINGVNFGVTNALTLGAGAILLPGVGSQTIFLTPKVCLNREGAVKFGLGTIAVFSFVRMYRYTGGTSSSEYTETQFGGVAYGSVTFGNEEKNASISAGWAYGENTTVSRTPVFGVSYLARVGRKVAFVTDNFLVPSGDGDFVGGLLSGGVRLFGERIGGDLGLFVPVASGVNFIAIPYASLRVKFGKKYGVD